MRRGFGAALLMGLLAFACGSNDDDEGAGAGGDPCEGALANSCGSGCSSDSECGAGTYCGGLGTCTADCTPGGGQCVLGECSQSGRCTVGQQGSGSYDGGIVDLTEDELALIDDDACAGWSAEPEPDESILMLVVDTSGSMDVSPGDQGGPSKWDITEDALREAIDNLPASTAVGVLYYPDRSNVSESDSPRDPDVCVNFDSLVPIEPLGNMQSSQRSLIDDSLSEASPRGGTPTHDAYDFALGHLENTPLAGSKNMVLITDGQPTFSQNCVGSGLVSEPVEEQPIVDAVGAAFQDGVRTFVIGSPGSEMSWTSSNEPGEDTRPWLSTAAEVGGTSAGNCSHDGEPYCHFDMSVEPDFATGLSDALAAISGSVISCSYTLPTPPSGQALDPNAVNVVITGGSGQNQLVLRDDGNACSEGWQYVDGGSRVELCEDSCDRVLNDPEARLQLFFGCATLDDAPIK